MAPSKPTRPPYPPLRVHVAQDAGGVTVCLVGELDMASVVVAQLALQRAARAESEVVLDLSHTSFLDAAGVRFLISAHQRARAAGWRLILRRPNCRIRRVLEVTGALGVLNIEEDSGPDAGHRPPA